MDKEFIKGQLKSALYWLNKSNTKKDVLHAKDSINMALKELEDNMEQNNKQTMPDFELGTPFKN